METIRERATKAKAALDAWDKKHPECFTEKFTVGLTDSEFKEYMSLEADAQWTSQEADRIDALKLNWRRDPCYDLYATEGNEEYYDELYVYSLEQQLIWADARNIKLQDALTLLRKAFKILQDLDPNAF